ncbi:hypothetical protein PHYSODRAFT_296876 [Phytophthora sojae]|uniref:Uncharacterized protein n=1 Tax=Phytophthora sojae (strain P6497) TaxID=1094619 RepID=G4YX07_PHYSP|nr:hypothetical protein PHYSODRAFT_296876 [Phytophthora sojae]EGZ25014.1 hypothetical protein PHYSODRAFT_296876 [Phytophthora sojae]|eukprot:XP_009520302.1 hypothetical protein PHYSODRAFT_296876 [Phytophthora sojae]
MATQAGIYFASQIFCLPCELLLNFGLFQFLIFLFHERRQEATIVILTNDVNKKFKIAAISRLSKAAQVLVALSCFVLVINVIDVAAPELGLATAELVDVIIQHISLAFVVGFRFYFLVAARGLAKVWRSQKLEIGFYLLLATHAVPFHALNLATGTLDARHDRTLPFVHDPREAFQPQLQTEPKRLSEQREGHSSGWPIEPISKPIKGTIKENSDEDHSIVSG